MNRKRTLILLLALALLLTACAVPAGGTETIAPSADGTGSPSPSGTEPPLAEPSADGPEETSDAPPTESAAPTEPPVTPSSEPMTATPPPTAATENTPTAAPTPEPTPSPKPSQTPEPTPEPGPVVYVKIQAIDTELLALTAVPYTADMTVEEAIALACEAAGLELSIRSAGTGRAYIMSIGEWEEFSQGAMSGWIYKVNGVHASRSIGANKLAEEDRVSLYFSLDMGADVKDLD